MKVMFRIEKNIVDIDYELYVVEGKHLKEILYELVDFDSTAEKRRIQDKLLNNDMNLCLLEIMRDQQITSEIFFKKLFYDLTEREKRLYAKILQKEKAWEKLRTA